MDDIVKQLQGTLSRPVPAGIEGPSLECREDGLDTVNVRIAMFGLDEVELGLECSGGFLFVVSLRTSILMDISTHPLDIRLLLAIPHILTQVSILQLNLPPHLHFLLGHKRIKLFRVHDRPAGAASAPTPA